MGMSGFILDISLMFVLVFTKNVISNIIIAVTDFGNRGMLVSIRLTS